MSHLFFKKIFTGGVFSDDKTESGAPEAGIRVLFISVMVGSNIFRKSSRPIHSNSNHQLRAFPCMVVKIRAVDLGGSNYSIGRAD